MSNPSIFSQAFLMNPQYQLPTYTWGFPTQSTVTTLPKYDSVSPDQMTPDMVLKEEPTSAPSSPNSQSSPSPSPKSGKVKRGRPQQDIEDDEDPTSQKRKHRRLYARQYRAQMRQKIDEVKKLQEELEMVKKQHQTEITQLNKTIMDLLHVNNQLLPAAILSQSRFNIS